MNFIFIGSLLAFAAVLLGAVGSHLLASRTDEAGLKRWDLAVRYHMWHALGLIIIGLAQTGAGLTDPSRLELAGGLLQGGIVLFSGSMYVMVLTGRRGSGRNWLGAVTPLGGLLLIAGWLSLAWAVW